MNNATKVYVSTFGSIMALAGLEHGIGEVLQGNVAPSEIMILSWPESAFFRSLGGEPAMTVIPNLLVTGILAILFSLALLVWVTRFNQLKNGVQVMILLSLAMLLFGGGIFPPILTILIAAVGTRINAPLTWWRTQVPAGLRAFLGKLWPWSYTAGILAWLCILPGIPILEHFSGEVNPDLILILLLFALGSLPLIVITGFAHDAQDKIYVTTGKLVPKVI
jgi:hypothetical protein